MRLLIILMLFGFASVCSAHDSDIAHVHSAGIATVVSNVVVNGTVVTSHRLGNSAIINQTFVLEGSTYTFNPETLTLTVRAKNDTFNHLPALMIVKIEDGKVYFSYTDSVQLDPFLFDKGLKDRTSYGLFRE